MPTSWTRRPAATRPSATAPRRRSEERRQSRPSATVAPPSRRTMVPKARAESGLASVYADGRDGYAGRRGACGERIAPGALTAAHRTLPCGARVTVTNSANGRSAVVRINDRGPFVRGRVIDLTPAGARALGFSGLAPVTLSRM